MLPGLLSGFGEGFGNWTSGQDADPNGLYKPEDYATARSNLLLRLGTSLMGAGMPMSGAQRAQAIQSLGSLPGEYRNDLRGTFHDRKISEEERQYEDMKRKLETGDVTGLNANQIAILKMVGPRAAASKLVDHAFAQPNRYEVGHDLVDENGRVIYQGQPEPPKPTDDMREYEEAVRQGFEGSFFDYQTALRRSGASQTTVDMKSETKLEEERGKGLGQRLTKLADDGDVAILDSVSIQRLEQLSQAVDPGTRTATLNSIRETTGVALDPNADNVQAFSAIINHMIPRMRIAGSGTTSDRDMAAFEASLPSLMGTPGGNQLVLKTMKAVNTVRVERGKIAQLWQEGEISAKEARQRMNQLPDPFQEFKTMTGGADRDDLSLDAIEQELRRRGVQ